MDGRTTIASITERTAKWARETATGTEAVVADATVAEEAPGARRSEGPAERAGETGIPAESGGNETPGARTAIAPSMRADGTATG
jgi:hypothetical protein